MYLQDNENKFRVIDNTIIDNAFINECYNLYRVYPFYFNFFIENIIRNKEITYFRDTTCIINIDKIEFKNLEILFIILKTFVKKEIIKKIIYKKEFIIIHFSEYLHMEYINNYNMIVAIPIYVSLKKNFINSEIYFGIYVNEEFFYEIMLKYNNKNYFFVSNAPVKKLVDYYNYIYFYKRRKNISLNTVDDFIKVDFDKESVEKNLVNIIKKQAADPLVL